MGTRRDIVDFLLDQLAGIDELRAQRMFGQFGLYVGDRFVAVVCDDELYIKPTAGGRAHFPQAQGRAPFPGARPWLAVPGERWEDRHWLVQLVLITAGELPPVRPKRRARRLGPGGS